MTFNSAVVLGWCHHIGCFIQHFPIMSHQNRKTYQSRKSRTCCGSCRWARAGSIWVRTRDVEEVKLRHHRYAYPSPGQSLWMKSLKKEEWRKPWKTADLKVQSNWLILKNKIRSEKTEQAYNLLFQGWWTLIWMNVGFHHLDKDRRSKTILVQKASISFRESRSECGKHHCINIWHLLWKSFSKIKFKL